MTRFSIFLILFSLILAACAVPLPASPTTPAATPAPPSSLTLVTHDSFDVSEEVLQQFQKQTGIKIQILKSGDAGEMLNTLIL
ncbi:MAG: thiamine ABC transporter substrate-binding protein, partial [Chloroflexi bacterium]|nr:thiamine ABC transporter substrate-binding protein [Chloroflexota bacterium]